MFFLDRRYGFFIRPATARFSCTVKRLKVRRALGHSGVGIIIYIPGAPVSRMKQWSQAAFAQWLIQASGRNVPINSLKFVIRSWVTNGETQDQVFQALRSVGATEVPNFANRKVFSRTATDAAEADGFYAILGTPNGAGSGFLLATHKTELGVKRFKSVTVWNHPVAAPFGVGSFLKLMLSFEIEDVAQPTTG
jgi:hypothetical protein